MSKRNHTRNQSLKALSEALQSGRFIRMRRLLASLYSDETAHLLESLPPIERKVCKPVINPDLRGEVLSCIGIANGLVWTIAIAFVTYLWFDSPFLGTIIGVAITVNIITATIVGVNAYSFKPEAN